MVTFFMAIFGYEPIECFTCNRPVGYVRETAMCKMTITWIGCKQCATILKKGD